ncbi:MAG: SDR family NAD(P)-dependent oxidoreductase [Muribaculaceae bacterium]|nr:SDR family NAD(P)-dependent oxidoreductase [Muribaculaceae bacterium]
MRTVLITGATSGIGRACAVSFHKAGYAVLATGRNTAALAELKNELGDNCYTMAFDVCDETAVKHAIESIPDEFKNIDVLVNNAGLALGLEPEYEGNTHDWSEMIDTNIKGLLGMTRLIVPNMLERGQGHIINIGSVAGDAAYAGGAVYCATKAAVKAITDGLRIDLVDTPLRVTLIKPGLVETNFSNIRFHGDRDRASAVYRGIEALTAEDIADTVLYAAQAPAHVQIAEMLILATRQANGSIIIRH